VLRKPAEELGGYIEAGFGQFGAASVRALGRHAGLATACSPSSRAITSQGRRLRLEPGDRRERPERDRKALGLRAAVRFLISDGRHLGPERPAHQGRRLNILNFASGSGGQAYRGGVVANGGRYRPPARQVELAPQRCDFDLGVRASRRAARASISRSRFSCTGLRQSGTPLANLVVGDKRNYNLGNEVKNIVRELQRAVGHVGLGT
jgi:hypothetical protein